MEIVIFMIDRLRNFNPNKRSPANFSILYHIDGYRLKGEVRLWSAVVFFRVTRCGKVHTAFKSGAISGKVYGRGCSTKVSCDNAKTTVLKACEDAKAAGADAECEINCCSGDLCNAGVTPLVSGLLILSCALMALFRWAKTVLLGKKTRRDRNYNFEGLCTYELDAKRSELTCKKALEDLAFYCVFFKISF